MDYNTYNSPFTNRYGSDEMRTIFSDHSRHYLWRQLWTVLAEAQSIQGIPITMEQIDELRRAATEEPIDYSKVAEFEAITHHDVVAHIKEFETHCPKAKGIIHLGATSCYVTDNADMLLIRLALESIITKLEFLIVNLAVMAEKYGAVTIVGRTHLQRAQMTTMGKRICMWINDFDLAHDQMCFTHDQLALLGFKGAVGAQNSAKTMFNDDRTKADYIDKFIGDKFGMDVLMIAGQTYTRIFDSMVANALSLMAQAMSKMATDIRLMSAIGEMYEHFSDGQVGSSAMPYKRNPINCEKVCGLARFVITTSQNMAITTATQWLERTLDDSSNRRITLPEIFLAADECIITMQNVVEHLEVNESKCFEHMAEHAKYAALEDDVILQTLAGKNRMDAHEEAINSDGIKNAMANSGYAYKQTMEYIENIYKKYDPD